MTASPFRAVAPVSAVCAAFTTQPSAYPPRGTKPDCRQNELGSRIFVGMVFVDYAKCLHFYPSFPMDEL